MAASENYRRSYSSTSDLDFPAVFVFKKTESHLVVSSPHLGAELGKYRKAA